MRNNRSAKIIALCALCVLSILGFASFAADPSFSITPSSWTQLKLYCKYNFGIVINPGGQSYNGFDSTVHFDSGTVNISHVSINPFFTSTTNGFIKSWFLYRAYGVNPGGSWSNILTAAYFMFSTVSYTPYAFLEFTTLTGGAIAFDINTTDDGAVINSSISSLDMLTGVTNAGYPFILAPCIMDEDKPSMLDTDTLNGARYITTWHIVSFTLYDRRGAMQVVWPEPLTGNSTSHYRYSWLTLTTGNYQPAPASVDNQEGVNSGSIQVFVTCPTCAGSRSYSPALTITTWPGDDTHNRYTRDSEDRGYDIRFTAHTPYGYEVEKAVTIVITGADNPNLSGITHTGNFTIIFNTPQNPTITMDAPTSGATFVNTNYSPLEFTFTDDRAGIDTWTISITIPTIFSGMDILYTGKTYSGNDITITLISWSAGLGNAWSYHVSLIPILPFPNSTWISITGYVKDLAGNTTTGHRQFTTRPSCASLLCTDTFQLNILWWFYSWPYPFTGSLIIVTWTNLNSPYPYLTGTNNEILMCGRPYIWPILTWNIWIYDSLGTSIKGTTYTSDELYITGMDGLDFIISGWVIIVQ